MPASQEDIGGLCHCQTVGTGELLSEVLAQLTEGVVTLTAAGGVASWNPPAAQMTGYTLAEVNHQGFWRLFDPPDVRLDLVQQYLSLARTADLQREPVDFGSYLEAFGAAMQEQRATRGITLQLKHLTSLGQVALHPNSFRRVLLTLVHNAVEAMPDGGSLTFHGQRRPTTVCLESRDNGCGIPPDQIPLLFSPLHTTKPEGTGLGLYLGREIITAHEGQIAVRSTPGMGTTFRLLLPLCAPEQESQSSPSRDSADGHYPHRR